MGPSICKKFILTTLLCYISASAVAALDACDSDDISFESTPDKYYCDTTPNYVTGSGAVVTSNTPDQVVDGSTFKFTLSPALSFTELDSCFDTETTGLSCSDMELSFGSAVGQDDGSPIRVGEIGAAGLATFVCSEGSNVWKYHFVILYDGAGDSTGDAKTTVDQLGALATNPSSSSTVGTASDVTVSVFDKFGEVDASTDTYVLNEGGTMHKLFNSDATHIALKEGDYTVLKGGQTFNPVTASPVCDNGVQLCFSEGCGESSGSASQGSGSGRKQTLLALLITSVPFILSLFV